MHTTISEEATRATMAKDTMRAVVFKGAHKVVLENRPIPKIDDDKDIIVKVIYSALCGSELHVFRGHQPSPENFIMGHEFTGTVEEVGSAVKGFTKGDQVVSPFTVSWYVEGSMSGATANMWIVETVSIVRTGSHRDAQKEPCSGQQRWTERRPNTSGFHWLMRR